MAIQMEIQRDLLFLEIPSPRGTAFDPARGLRELEQREIECHCARYCKSKPGIDRRACPFRVNSRAIAIHRLYPLHNRGLKGREGGASCHAISPSNATSEFSVPGSLSVATHAHTHVHVSHWCISWQPRVDGFQCVRACVCIFLTKRGKSSHEFWCRFRATCSMQA